MPRHSHDFIPTDFGTFNVDPGKPLGPQLVAELRRKILNMDLKPGVPVSEAELALASSASRTPARQAVKQLVSEGLLESFPSRGTFVAPIQLNRLRDALFIRETLEPEVARRRALAEDHLPLADRLDALIQRHADALEAGQHAEAYAIDSDFHQALSGDGFLWQVLQQARAQGDRLHALSKVRGESMSVALAHHRRIAGTIRDGDGAASHAAMLDHLKDNHIALDVIVDEFPDYFLTESDKDQKGS